MLFSKKGLLGVILLTSITGLASAANYKGYKDAVLMQPSLRDGFYVGLQGGYDSYHVKQTDNLGVATASTTMSPTGWIGGLFAGYGMSFDLFYLGGEVFVNTSGAESTDSFNNTSTGVSGTQKFSANTSYGLAILPGIKFTPATLSYLRLGYNWANLKVTETLTGAGDDSSARDNHTSNGFAFGVGIETLVPQISDHVSIRADYIYTDYDSFTPSGGNLKFNPSDNQFMVGIIYRI